MNLFATISLCMYLCVPIAVAFDVNPAGIAVQAWDMYRTMLTTDPLLTKSLTSSGMMTLSDAICQKLMMKTVPKEEQAAVSQECQTGLDRTRMLHVAVTGLTWSGPIQHWWFGALDKIVAIQDPVVRLLVQLLLDSIIFSPLTISGYFTWRSMLEGSGFQGARVKLSTRFMPTLFGAWKFWPIVNMVNFSMVPLQFRVLYSSILSLFWTGYLTFVNAK